MDQKYNDLSLGGNLDADRFHEGLKERGFNFATGIPCGVLKHFVSNFESDKEFTHIVAQNEPESIGIAVGAYLGGGKPIAYMQNSGLLKSTNEIGSLVLPYRVDLPFLVGYRGVEGEDVPQHKITGRITEPVLELLGIPSYSLGRKGMSVEGILESLRENPAILVERGWSDKNVESKAIRKYEPRDKIRGAIEDNTVGEVSLNRESSLDIILDKTETCDAVFSTTGLISRSIYERHDSSNQFYNTGSFGLVSSIGLGFSVMRPDTKTFVIDGDASLLTNLGSLATVGNYRPKNLLHIVLDNEAFGSCSEERSSSENNLLAETAAIHGYEKVIVVNDEKGLCDAIESSEDKCTFVQVKINLGGRRDFKRPLDLAYIARRFKQHFEND